MQIIVLTDRKQFRDVFIKLGLPSITARPKSDNPNFNFMKKMTESKVFRSGNVWYRLSNNIS